MEHVDTSPLSSWSDAVAGEEPQHAMSTSSSHSKFLGIECKPMSNDTFLETHVSTSPVDSSAEEAEGQEVPQSKSASVPQSKPASKRGAKAKAKTKSKLASKDGSSKTVHRDQRRGRQPTLKRKAVDERIPTSSASDSEASAPTTPETRRIKAEEARRLNRVRKGKKKRCRVSAAVTLLLCQLIAIIELAGKGHEHVVSSIIFHGP